jgi:hypothetical protein
MKALARMLALAATSCATIQAPPPNPDVSTRVKCWYAPAGSACPVYSFSCGHLWEVSDSSKECTEKHGACDERIYVDTTYAACWEERRPATAKQGEG